MHLIYFVAQEKEENKVDERMKFNVIRIILTFGKLFVLGGRYGGKDPDIE